MAIFIVVDPESRRSEGCENCAVPNHPNKRKSGARWGPRYGTRIHFPLHPALRLRLCAELNHSAPTALGFPLANSTGKSQVSFSHTLFRLASRRLSVPTFPPLWLLKRTTAAEAIFLFASNAALKRSSTRAYEHSNSETILEKAQIPAPY